MQCRFVEPQEVSDGQSWNQSHDQEGHAKSEGENRAQGESAAESEACAEAEDESRGKDAATGRPETEGTGKSGARNGPAGSIGASPGGAASYRGRCALL